MDRNYTLKDILLEAGVREYYNTFEDRERIPSDRHKKDMEKLFNKQTSIFEKISGSPLYKGLSIAAAVAILFGAAIAIKPVREPVASFFANLFGASTTSETTDDPTGTDPEGTGEGSVIVTDTETDPDVTDPGDECAPPGHLSVTCGGVTVYPGVYLMWTEQYDDKSGEWLSGDGFGTTDNVPLLHGNRVGINYEDREDRASVSVSLHGSDALVYASVDELNAYLSTADDGVYRFTISYTLTGRLIDGKYEKTCYQYLIDVEVNNGQETTEPFKIPETDEEWIDYLFSSMAKNGYTKEKWEKLKTFGLTAFDRLVLKYDDEALTDYAKAIISIFAAGYLKDEIKANENIYKRFDTTGFPETVETGAGGWLSQYRSIAEAYAKTNDENTVKSNFPMMYRFLTLIGFNGYPFSPSQASVSQCIDFYITDYLYSPVYERNSSTILSNLISEERRDETLDYVLQNYFTEENDARQTLLSWLYFNISRLEIKDFTNGSELEARVSALERTDDIFIEDDLGVKAKEDVRSFLSEYTAFAKTKAKELIEYNVKTDYPYTYKVLTAAGFDEYDKKEVDIADKSHPAIKAALDLFMLLKCGTPYEDGTCRTAGRENMSYVYGYFGKYFSKETIDNLITESGFTISDGVLYYEEIINAGGSRVRYDTVKLISENGNTATVEATLYIPDPVYHEFGYVPLTFEITDGSTGIKITGGNFFDILMSPAFNRIDPVYNTIASYMLLREGQKRYVAVKEADYMNYEDLPEELKEKVGEGAEFPISDIDRMFYEAPIRKNVAGYIYDDLIYRETEVFHDGLIFISKAPGKVKPAFDFFSHPGYEIHDDGSLGPDPFSILFNMKNVKTNGKTVEFTLDFEVDGVTSAYSFIIDYDEIRGMILTGGTFADEILLKN